MHRFILERGLGIALAAGVVAGGQAHGQEVPSSAADRTAVSITVYNGDFGLVREARRVTLPGGRAILEFGDVAARIQPETVHIAARSGSLSVLEQNYQYDLLNPRKLLEKYVGRTVKIYRTNPQTGVEQELEAEVLSVNDGTVLRIGDEITYDYPGRFAFPEIPDNLIAQPTLQWLVDGATGGELEVSYLTDGLDWKSDYVLVVNADDSEGAMTGWVTLTNQSGASYEDAQLKLVAGDVQRVGPDRAVDRMRRDVVARAAAELQFQEESFFEYHLYTLERRTNLLNNEQKQIALLEGQGISLRKRLVFAGEPYFYRSPNGRVQRDAKVSVFLDFTNDTDNGLGMPLPRGVVRVYKEDDTGAQQFIGEDRIDHTPRNESVSVRMGESFDVVGERRQLDFDVLSNCSSESAWEVTVRNRKEEAADVVLQERAGGDWTVVTSSAPVRQVDVTTFEYDVRVPANGEVTVTYRVRVRWC